MGKVAIMVRTVRLSGGDMFVVLRLQVFKSDLSYNGTRMIGVLPVFESQADAWAEYPGSELVQYARGGEIMEEFPLQKSQNEKISHSWEVRIYDIIEAH